MKTIVESIIGRRGSNKKLYIVSPKGSDNYLYWNSKFTYNGVADSHGYFYFVLTKDELQKFLPQEPDTSIYLVDDDTVGYKKLEQDVKKTKDLLNNPPIYLKKVDVMSISESIIGRRGNNPSLYVVHPGASDLDFYWDLEETHKFQYPCITNRFGMFLTWHYFYFVLSPGEFKKFTPRDEETLIYTIEGNIDYEKIKKDLEKGGIPPYMKQVDIKSVL